MIASIREHVQLSPNTPDLEGIFPIQYALMKGHISLCVEMLERGFFTFFKPPTDTISIQMLVTDAVEKTLKWKPNLNSEFGKLLSILFQFGFDFNQTDSGGKSVIQRSIQMKRSTVTSLILQFVAGILRYKTKVPQVIDEVESSRVASPEESLHRDASSPPPLSADIPTSFSSAHLHTLFHSSFFSPSPSSDLSKSSQTLSSNLSSPNECVIPSFAAAAARNGNIKQQSSLTHLVVTPKSPPISRHPSSSSNPSSSLSLSPPSPSPSPSSATKVLHQNPSMSIDDSSAASLSISFRPLSKPVERHVLRTTGRYLPNVSDDIIPIHQIRAFEKDLPKTIETARAFCLLDLGMHVMDLDRIDSWKILPDEDAPLDGVIVESDEEVDEYLRPKISKASAPSRLREKADTFTRNRSWLSEEKIKSLRDATGSKNESKNQRQTYRKTRKIVIQNPFSSEDDREKAVEASLITPTIPPAEKNIQQLREIGDATVTPTIPAISFSTSDSSDATSAKADELGGGNEKKGERGESEKEDEEEDDVEGYILEVTSSSASSSESSDDERRVRIVDEENVSKTSAKQKIALSDTECDGDDDIETIGYSADQSESVSGSFDVTTSASSSLPSSVSVPRRSSAKISANSKCVSEKNLPRGAKVSCPPEMEDDYEVISYGMRDDPPSHAPLFDSESEQSDAIAHGVGSSSDLSESEDVEVVSYGLSDRHSVRSDPKSSSSSKKKSSRHVALSRSSIRDEKSVKNPASPKESVPLPSPTSLSSLTSSPSRSPSSSLSPQRSSSPLTSSSLPPSRGVSPLLTSSSASSLVSPRAPIPSSHQSFASFPRQFEGTDKSPQPSIHDGPNQGNIHVKKSISGVLLTANRSVSGSDPFAAYRILTISGHISNSSHSKSRKSQSKRREGGESHSRRTLDKSSLKSEKGDSDRSHQSSLQSASDAVEYGEISRIFKVRSDTDSKGKEHLRSSRKDSKKRLIDGERDKTVVLPFEVDNWIDRFHCSLHEIQSFLSSVNPLAINGKGLRAMIKRYSLLIELAQDFVYTAKTYERERHTQRERERENGRVGTKS